MPIIWALFLYINNPIITHMRYFFFLLVLSSCWSACKSTQPTVTTRVYTHCFKAIDGDDTYVMMLFRDSSFVWCKNLGERVSWGRYHDTREGWRLTSFIASLDQMPLVVVESYDPAINGTQVRVHGWSNVLFLGTWTGFPASKATIDGEVCIQWSGAASSAEYLQIGQCSTKVTQTIGLQGRGMPEQFYTIKDPQTNVLDWYYLYFRADQFQVFKPTTALFDKHQYTLPTCILDDVIGEHKLLRFEKVKTVVPNISLRTSVEGTVLAAYQQFKAGGRTRLLQNL